MLLTQLLREMWSAWRSAGAPAAPQSAPGAAYSDAVFRQRDLQAAKEIILNPAPDMTTDERWEFETRAVVGRHSALRPLAEGFNTMTQHVASLLQSHRTLTSAVSHDEMALPGIHRALSVITASARQRRSCTSHPQSAGCDRPAPSSRC